jgi:cytochrome c-type biogenesis protein CcmE
MKKNKKLIIGGFIILVSVAILGYVGFMGGRSYYYDVSAYLAKGPSVFSQSNNITGVVAPGPQQTGNNLKFTLQDTKDSSVAIAVSYQGAVPDTFGEGRELVVEGKYDPVNKIFQATQIITKCSSKYAPE